MCKREDLFITSKLWNTAHKPAEIEKELDETLQQLGTSYLDLYRASQVISVFVHLLIYLGLSDPLACCVHSKEQS